MFKRFIIKWIKVRRKRTKKTPQDYARLRVQAKQLVVERLEHFNQFYGFSYKKIFIKNQSTRWGSCSSKSNLNFNYRIITLEPELQDYLVVHELCHLGEMNHGASFWKLVEQTIPNYKTLDHTLKRQSLK
jgi:predicted metal-dependent hydrolase